MAEWRYLRVVYPNGDVVTTVLKGAVLPAKLLSQLGNLGLSLELAGALSMDEAHEYETLHGEAKARPTFGWYPYVSLPEEKEVSR